MVNASNKNDDDLYGLLGLKQGASDGEIRNAYYRRAKEHHPDRRKEDEKAGEDFRAIARAAAILRDPERRSLHEHSGMDEAASAAKPKAVQRRSNRRAIALVFLVSLGVSTAGATRLWLVLLSRTSEVSNLAGNDRRATSSEVADASVPLEKPIRSYGPEATPLPSNNLSSPARDDSGAALLQKFSFVNEGGTQDKTPPPMQGAISSSPASERPADTGEKAAPPAPGVKALSRPYEPPSRQATAFGMPAFDTSPGGGKPLPAKLLALREEKSKPANCAISRAARDILVHVSATIKGG